MFESLSIYTDPVVIELFDLQLLLQLLKGAVPALCLWIPRVSGKETGKQRKFGFWAEVETCVLNSPIPSKLSTSKCIFDTLVFFLMERKEKNKPETQTFQTPTTVQRDAVSSFSLLRQLQTTPCQLLPLSRYSRANAHQHVAGFPVPIGNNTGSFETKQELSNLMIPRAKTQMPQIYMRKL